MSNTSDGPDWLEVEWLVIWDIPVKGEEWVSMEWPSGAAIRMNGTQARQCRADHDHAGIKSRTVRCWRDGRREVIDE